MVNISSPFIVTTTSCLVADVQPRGSGSRSAPGRRFRCGSNLLLLRGFLLAFTVSTVACAQNPSTALSEFGVDETARERISLPERLREISGLAMTADGRALAHDDEVGIIYEIDHRQGRVVKEFRLGNDTVRADFEGIAVAGDRIYLVTSDGTIYESPEGRKPISSSRLASRPLPRSHPWERSWRSASFARAGISDLSLVIADEDKRRGQLTLYRQSPPAR